MSLRFGVSEVDISGVEPRLYIASSPQIMGLINSVSVPFAFSHDSCSPTLLLNTENAAHGKVIHLNVENHRVGQDDVFAPGPSLFDSLQLDNIPGARRESWFERSSDRHMLFFADC